PCPFDALLVWNCYGKLSALNHCDNIASFSNQFSAYCECLSNLSIYILRFILLPEK
ncbi:hypothetical protein L9F63_020190, partial [Diploptera punctata]